MGNEQKARKLSLNVDTLRQLTSQQTKEVVGGTGQTHQVTCQYYTQCDCEPTSWTWCATECVTSCGEFTCTCP